jgi:hypothetical protein
MLATSQKRGEDPDRILVSRDEGATFQPLMQGFNLLDGSFSADGATAFVVGNDALYRSNLDLTQATPLGEAQFVSHVTHHEGKLYVCGNPSGFDPINVGLASSVDDGETFT